MSYSTKAPALHCISTKRLCSHISLVDDQLDRLQLLKQPSAPSSPELHSASDETQDHQLGNRVSENGIDMTRVLKLQTAIKVLSTASSSRALLPSETILATLDQARALQASASSSVELSGYTTQEQELEWLLVSKATAQTYGLLLNVLLEQTLPLSSDIGYWSEILGSYGYTALYTIQTSPLRLWGWSNDIYSDAWQRLQSIRSAGNQKEEDKEMQLMSHRWSQFYGLVRDSVRDRSLADVQSKFLSPLTMSRMKARSKRRRLTKLREMSASGLGILMDEGLVFDADDEDPISPKTGSNNQDEWRSVVSKSVSLMETVLKNITVLELGASEFEETVFMNVYDDSGSPHHGAEDQPSSQASRLADRLQHILRIHVPAHVATSKQLTSKFGRPSWLVRYWLPGLALILSSGTLVHVFVNRQAEIVTWIRDFGDTTIDFWNNWVIEPTKKVIGTIRHDKDSEIAIMSKGSLQGDRASLERMVVDFAVDNASTSSGARLTDSEIADVRAKVREGDLTPVLKAYEKELRRPFVGTVRGDLIRALLIQIQKTKVDVEFAVGGIDNLLKSQELVFGYVPPNNLAVLILIVTLASSALRLVF